VLVPLGELLVERGHPAEAEPLLREALAIRREVFGVEDRRTAEAAAILHRALLALGRRAGAEGTSRPGAAD
jgi:serine/threonine-protein kinase